MIKLDQALCIGCGVCVHSCPVGAISIVDRTAYIDAGKCIECENCCSVCPRGAISNIEVFHLDALKARVKHLDHEIKSLLQRIDKIMAKG